MRHFKVKSFGGANSACDKAVLCAANANGSGYHLTLKSIAIMAQVEATQNPEIPSTIYIDGNSIIIDCKREGEWVQGCVIEEVDIAELASIDDLKGIFESN